MKDLFVIIIAISVIAAIVICAPLVTLWSLNTIFPALAIPYNVATWAASFWLSALVTGGLVSLKYKK